MERCGRRWGTARSSRRPRLLLQWLLGLLGWIPLLLLLWQWLGTRPRPKASLTGPRCMLWHVLIGLALGDRMP